MCFPTYTPPENTIYLFRRARRNSTRFLTEWAERCERSAPLLRYSEDEAGTSDTASASASEGAMHSASGADSASGAAAPSD